MIRTQVISVSALANAETQVDKLTTPGGMKRIYRALVMPNTAGIILRAYLEQDRVQEVDMNNALFISQPLVIDIPVDAGASLTITAVNSTGAPIAVSITVVYDETAAA